MTTLSNFKRAENGAPLALVFEAAAEAAFAMIGDRRGLAYALQCASAALLTASQAVETLHPADGGGQ